VSAFWNPIGLGAKFFMFECLLFANGASFGRGRPTEGIFRLRRLLKLSMSIVLVITVLQKGWINAGTVNARRTTGGFVFIDPENFKFQAALFRGNSLKMIPFLDLL